MNKISVVTITYNNFDELLQTLESVKLVNNVENVIVNGGDCARTKEYLLQHPQYVSISEKDAGISDAFNKGIKLASGDCICFLNSGDMLLDKNYYEFALNHLKKQPDLDYIYADILYDHITYGKMRVLPNNHIAKTPFPHPGLIIKKNRCLETGGFNISFKIAMDFEFMCKMKKLKLKGHYYDLNPVVLMNGFGISSANGLPGIEERRKALIMHRMLSAAALVYFINIKLKISLRSFLQTLGLLKIYDYLKSRFFNIKPE